LHSPIQMEKLSYVYILASGRYGTLYIGVTSDLIRRVWQHKQELTRGFTQQYCVKHLVWYEQHADIRAAITREKNLKKWRREWKIELIHRSNPLWHDLYPTITA
jgi:putative endonuclease